jgi:hypothetical protein
MILLPSSRLIALKCGIFVFEPFASRWIARPGNWKEKKAILAISFDEKAKKAKHDMADDCGMSHYTGKKRKQIELLRVTDNVSMIRFEAEKARRVVNPFSPKENVILRWKIKFESFFNELHGNPFMWLTPIFSFLLGTMRSREKRGKQQRKANRVISGRKKESKLLSPRARLSSIANPP